jgi:hypothetical protein
MARLQDPDCHKYLCNNKDHLDPEATLLKTTYRILGFAEGNEHAGAATASVDSVFINESGPFLTEDKTEYIPSERREITSPREVPFPSVAAKDAFILLHELGHQLGIFPPDVFRWINGTHSLRILEHCFKDVKFE